MNTTKFLGKSHQRVGLIILAVIVGVLLGLLHTILVAFPRYWAALPVIEFNSTDIQSPSTFRPGAGWWVNVATDETGARLTNVRGQGPESVASIILPQASAYRMRIVLTHLPGSSANGQVQVYLNETFLGELEAPVQAEAQSFELIVPATTAREGANTLRFVYPVSITSGNQPNDFLFHSITLQGIPTPWMILLIVIQTSPHLMWQVSLLLAIFWLVQQTWPYVGGWFTKQFSNPWEVLGRLALLIFGVALALIMAELALRLLLPSQSGAMTGDLNPWVQYVGWAGNPHQTRLNTRFGTLIQYNSKGLRDVERPYEKPPDTFRILVLGDSFVEAEQIGNLAEIFPRLLEGLLNQHGQASGLKFEVIAAGVSGWGTDQHLLYYQYEGYKYQPDLVLVSFTSNDIADSYVPWRMKQTGWPEGCIYKPYFELAGDSLALRNFPYYTQTLRAIDEEAATQVSFVARLKSYLYEHTRVYRSIVDAVEVNFPQTNSVLTWLGFMPVKVEQKPSRCQQATSTQGDPLLNNYVFKAHYSVEDETAWTLDKALIRQLKVETERQGAPLVIVANAQSAPLAYIRTGQTLYTDPAGVQWDWGKVNHILADICQQENIPFLELDPIFIQSPYTFEELYVPEDGHYNRAGHRLAAQTIYEWLVEQAFVP